MANRSLRHRLTLGITLSIGVCLSAIATVFVHQWDRSQQYTRFQQQIENLTIALQRSLNRYTTVLTFLNDHYQVNQGEVQRQEFERFVARSLSTYPGIQALEWAPLIRQTERLSYEKAIQANGYPDFRITELTDDNRLIPAGDRPVYLPVTYLAPFDSNEAAFGFDLYSSDARAAALDPARDSGDLQATGRIRLVQEQRDQYGFLVVLPLYRSASLPTTVDTRQAQFEGVLLGVFRVSDVVEEALLDLSYAVDFVLYDHTAPVNEQFLGRYEAMTKTVTASALEGKPDRHAQSDSRLCPTPNDCTRSLDIAQREWLILFSPAETYRLNTPYGTWATLLTGLLVTGSLALLLYNIQNELTRTQALNDLKQRFFSMASHELRTPLSTILLSTESLQTHGHELLEDQKQATLQRVHLTAQQMSQQVTDLLTLTRAEAGQLEFTPELLDVASFLKHLVDELQAGMKQPIQVTIPTQGIKAFWDKKLVRSLLSNLLSNAAKYSPSDSPIHLTVRSDSHTATIEVGDRGIGIPVEDHVRIQDAFQRGSNVSHIAGTGLGLAIVNTCVELHRGEWHIDSTEGQGTTVTVTLPLE
jgi:signal transduction histidine kinase